MTQAPDLDVAIIGAGISGISMAAHIARDCPGRRFAVLERRAAVGGTWDLFRYPGVRSDSDMHTLGFGFAPWRAAAAGIGRECNAGDRQRQGSADQLELGHP